MGIIYSAIAAVLFTTLAGTGHGQTQSHLITALDRLAQADDHEALYHLGMAYHTGSGVTKNSAKALAYFRRAAALGDPLAAYKLGCYFDGQGEGLIAEDGVEALKYKLIAAEAGYALAEQDVAAIYARRGNFVAAVMWIKKAAAQGLSEGLMTYSSVHNGAPGIVPDPAVTAAYFQLFLNRVEATGDQRAWLKNFKTRMSPADLNRAAEIVRDYQPAPTEITIKALSGQRAAEALIARAGIPAGRK